MAEGRLVDRVVAVIENAGAHPERAGVREPGGARPAGGRAGGRGPARRADAPGALELALSQRLQVLEADRLQAFPAERCGGGGALKAFRRALRERAGAAGLPGPARGGPGAAHRGAGARRAGRAHPGQPHPAAGPGGRGRGAALLGAAHGRSWGGPYECAAGHRCGAAGPGALRAAREGGAGHRCGRAPRVRRVAPFAREARHEADA